MPRLARKYRLKKPRLFWLNQLSLHYKTISTNSECGKTNIATKLKNLNDLVSALRFGKSDIYEKMAGLQIVHDKPIIAATYYIRSFRLSEISKPDAFNYATSVLATNNYAAESDATKLLYYADQKHTGIKEYLEKQRKKLLQAPKFNEDFDYKDDRRKNSKTKISIIVSLYNAANKLEFFLKHLKRQSMVCNGTAEIILVDSGSPTNEREVFLKLIDSLKIEVIYVRTKSRETIQKAWNRGILLAQGEYLTFLGVDEGITPEALEILSAELDSDSSTDWIQSNSLMTDVSKNGTWLNDVMIFERSNFHPLS